MLGAQRGDFEPFLTRAEVLKVGAEHWTSCDKARRELGYRELEQPDKALQRCALWYTAHGYACDTELSRLATHSSRRMFAVLLFSRLLGMLFAGLLRQEK